MNGTGSKEETKTTRSYSLKRTHLLRIVIRRVHIVRQCYAVLHLWQHRGGHLIVELGILVRVLLTATHACCSSLVLNLATGTAHDNDALATRVGQVFSGFRSEHVLLHLRGHVLMVVQRTRSRQLLVMLAGGFDFYSLRTREAIQ